MSEATAGAPSMDGAGRLTAHRPRRRSRTKEDYLDAALVLANQGSRLGPAPYADAVAHVDVAQVAEAAGVSRTALYRMWETQQSFRADLAAHLAATDAAPWMAAGHGPVTGPSGPSGPDYLREQALLRFDAAQDELANDPRPLLRAGIAGYPGSAEVTSVLGHGERRRLARLARTLDTELGHAGRHWAPGTGAQHAALALTCLAEGIALAARFESPEAPLTLHPDDGRPCSLLAFAARALLGELSEPGAALRPPTAPAGAGALGASGTGRGGPEAGVAGTGRETAPAPAATRRAPTGRRRAYLRIAAGLAGNEPPPGAVTDGGALGHVRLDTLARSLGVARGTVRRLWSSQAAFRVDLVTHLLGRHRTSVARHLAPARPTGVPAAGPDTPTTDAGQPVGLVLAAAGDRLVAHAHAELGTVSHLACAPQLVVPTFREHACQRAACLLDTSADALGRLLATLGRRPVTELSHLQLAVTVLAFVDGMTRLVRTHPTLAHGVTPLGHVAAPSHGHRPGDTPGLGQDGHPLALAFGQLLVGLSRPSPPTGPPSRPAPGHGAAEPPSPTAGHTAVPGPDHAACPGVPALASPRPIHHGRT